MKGGSVSFGKFFGVVFMFIFGMILKFPKVLESEPVKYKVLFFELSAVNYLYVEAISYFIIMLSLGYFVILMYNLRRE